MHDSMTEALRAAIRSSGRTQMQISRGTGIPQPNISQFLTGKEGITLKTADRLARFLGLELRAKDGGDVK